MSSNFSLLFKIKKITDARFKAHGSPYTIAACSWLVERPSSNVIIRSQSVQCNRQFQKRCPLPVTKRYCAILLEDALKAALL